MPLGSRSRRGRSPASRLFRRGGKRRSATVAELALELGGELVEEVVQVALLHAGRSRDLNPQAAERERDRD